MIRISIIYIALIIAFFLASLTGLEKWIHHQKWIILSFFAMSSYIYHVLLEQAMRNDRSKFLEFYLASVTIRFISTLLFIGIFLYFKVAKPFLFVGNYFALYLFFTFFEIIDLYRKLRRF